jgi:RNA polymerase sigma-70 factor (ECF subfamily)
MDVPTPKNSLSPGPDLLASVAKGDQQAFEQLYEQTSALLYALAMRIVGNQDEAAELLQEVYLEVWRKASNYDAARGTPMAWLVTLARSRALDRVRALGSRGKGVTASLDDTPASGLVSTNSDALEMRAATERHALVGTALKGLPPVQRQAIELAFYGGLTHMEIAERLQTPLGTIKTRIRLGMEKLRDSLRSLWEEELGVPE